VQPETAAVGRPLIMTVTATHPPALRWEPRSVSDRLGSFDIDQTSGPEAVPGLVPGEEGEAGRVVTRWTFRLTAFELGEMEIPPFQLRYSKGDGEEIFSVSTPARTVRIEATVTDPQEEPSDIRWGFTLPAGSQLLAWIGALAVALLAGAGIWLWWRRRRGPAVEERAPDRPAIPSRPAYDRYLEALEALLGERLAESGRTKELHIRIAGIVKAYLGEVFAFDAIDRTTYEVMRVFGQLAKPNLRSETGEFLDRCDMVKFAKHSPSPEECQDVGRRARQILELGRR
jgi:hypothetical protein